jgi:hypothetical protein
MFWFAELLKGLQHKIELFQEAADEHPDLREAYQARVRAA